MILEHDLISIKKHTQIANTKEEERIKIKRRE
jgi:hypothetical protein